MAGPSDLVHELREPAGEPQGALVMMHGRGVDERDLLPLLDILDPQRRLLGICPGGPITDLPPGGRHWYVIERVGHPEPTSFHATYQRLGRFLGELLEERGITPDRAVLGGFSQGTAMAFALGLGTGRPRPAGILGLSGFIPTVEGWTSDPQLAAGLPVFLAHGARDPIISVEFARSARETLDSLGADLTYHETPMGHAIDPRLLPEAEGWLAALVEEA
ncbi:MAG: phospholipase [Actinomycetota bacterium]